MDGELIEILILLCLWVVSGGLTLWWWLNKKQRLSKTRAVIAQTLMIPVLPFWSYAYFSLHWGEPEGWEHLIDLVIIVASSVYQLLIVRFLLRARFPSFLTAWLVSLVPTYFFFVLSMPAHVSMPGNRPLVTKARGEMRFLTDALVKHREITGTYPIPVNDEGLEIEPVLIGNATEVTDATGTESIALYYRGPSVVPNSLIESASMAQMPLDPFKKGEMQTYNYGLGLYGKGRGAFILSSPGPDKIDQSDQVEKLYLDVHAGNPEHFREDPESNRIRYGPTNGTKSRGEIYRNYPR